MYKADKQTNQNIGIIVSLIGPFTRSVSLVLYLYTLAIILKQVILMLKDIATVYAKRA